jgi:TetR/AcrR family transcriptional repressor of nem operon
MARPREFHTQDALEQAMMVFWAKGYEGASLAELTGAMGLSKSSLYDTFGSKHELFLATIDYYNEHVAVRRIRGWIEGARGPRAGIAAVFSNVVADLLGQCETCGCFTNKCAGDVALLDAEAAQRCRAGFASLEAVFVGAVRDGQRSGEIPAARDARALARYLTASLQGLMVVGKARPEKKALGDIVGVVLAALD